MIKNCINIQENVKLKIRQLNEIKDTINRLFWDISNFILKLKNYSEFLNSFDNDNFLEYKIRIREMTNKGYNLICDFIDFGFEFNPPNYNNFVKDANNSNNSLMNSNSCFDSFLTDKYNREIKFESFSESNQKLSSEKEFSIKCFKCGNNNPIYLCKTCYILFCEKCIRDHQQNSEKSHSIIKFKDSKEKEKIFFLNSISYIIKNLLIKCDCLLKKGIMKIGKEDIDNSGVNYIKRITKFPYINNSFNFKDEIKFLNDIDEKYTDLQKTDNLQNSFHFSELDKNLIDTIKNILNEEQNILKENDIDDMTDDFCDDIENE